ncbi:MAG: hypothetical protein JNG90_16990, partial [Planctomycetaceae bacterium]|nr:hypothetical protein [Planctomycetaceae bacterium]
SSLGASTDDPLNFYIELLEGDMAVERIPREGAIETSVPSSEYELIMWHV